MKNLMKLVIIVLIFTMANETFAQTYCIKAGLNLSELLVKDDDENYSDTYKMNPGFNAGVTIEIPFSDVFSFETGLICSTKGTKTQDSDSFEGDEFEWEMKMRLYYLDIPLAVRACYDAGKANIYGTFGPYIGVGLAGKTKSKISYMGETEKDSEKIDWGNDEDDDDLKRFDAGLTFGAGVVISSVQIGISYGLGLANISTYTDGGATIKNRVLSISVGYQFGGE